MNIEYEFMGATATPRQLSPLQQIAEEIKAYSESPASADIGPVEEPFIQHGPIQVVEAPPQAEPMPGAPIFRMPIPDQLPTDFSIDTTSYYESAPIQSMQEQRASDSTITVPEDIQAHEYYSMMPTAEQVATAAESGQITLTQPAAEVIERIVERPIPYAVDQAPAPAPGKTGDLALPVLLGIGIYSIFFA